MPEVLRKDMRVVHETDLFPRGVELVRSGLDEVVREHLVAVLRGLHEDPAADAALQGYFGARKFDALSEQDEATLARLRESLGVFERQVSARQ
jgi:phosphonate transport system substrate-binding protein